MAVVRATKERVHLILGFAQGAGLFALVHSETWLNKLGADAGWFNAVLALILFGPLVAHMSLGTMSPRRFWALMVCSGALFLALGLFQGATVYPEAEGQLGPPLPAAALVGMGLMSFMLPPLVAAFRRRHQGAALWCWHYPTLFDLSWRNGVVIVQGILMAGLLGLVLRLGTSTLAMTGLDGPSNMLDDGALWLWVLPAAAAWGTGIGIHRPSFTLALRRHWFVFSRWMLPLVSTLGVALGVAGLYNLQAVSKGQLSYGVLLFFIALWVMLYSCAYEAGEQPPDYRPRLLGLLRFSALGLVLLLGLSFYGFASRELPGPLDVRAFWTLLILCVAALYALGYALTVPRRNGPWMQSIAPTNVLASLVIVAGLVLMLSPALDVRHLAAQSLLNSLPQEPTISHLGQLQRLRSMGLPGHDALVALSQQQDADGNPTKLATMASTTLEERRHGRSADATAIRAPAETPQMITEALFQMHPSGTIWPTGLFEAVEEKMALSAPHAVTGSCFSMENSTEKCQILQIDLNQDGTQEAVVWHWSFGTAWVFSRTGDSWALAAELARQQKTLLEIQRELEAGRVEALPPKWHNLRLGSQTVAVKDALP